MLTYFLYSLCSKQILFRKVFIELLSMRAEACVVYSLLLLILAKISVKFSKTLHK